MVLAEVQLGFLLLILLSLYQSVKRSVVLCLHLGFSLLSLLFIFVFLKSVDLWHLNDVSFSLLKVHVPIYFLNQVGAKFASNLREFELVLINISSVYCNLLVLVVFLLYVLLNLLIVLI